MSAALLIRGIWSNRKSRLGMVILLSMILCAFIGRFFVLDPSAFLAQPHLPPSYPHVFGTTGQGQDVFAQTIVGAGPTLLVGLTVGLLVTLIGTVVGVTAGYFGGHIDETLTALINIFLVIPGLPLAIILAAYLPPGLSSIIAVLTFTGWAWTARVIRSQTLSLSSMDFIKSAKIIGESDYRIIFVELLPHMASLLLSTFIGTTIYAIGAQVGLEFLGLGDVGAVTWGTNLYWAANDQALLTRAWWTYVPTGLGIALVGFALALINFGLDEVTNPRLSVDRFWKKKRGIRSVSAIANTPYLPSSVMQEDEDGRD